MNIEFSISRKTLLYNKIARHAVSYILFLKQDRKPAKNIEDRLVYLIIHILGRTSLLYLDLVCLLFYKFGNIDDLLEED